LSYNGSGVFQINSSGQPVVTGTVISSTAFNALTADLATGLSTAITKDGQTTTTARILFAQGVSSTLVTDATSATTGSIITAGGISMQKALWVGTTSRHVGATQFDAAITYGGVTLSNAVTGTGNMVLSASPTLTGTITLPGSTVVSSGGLIGILGAVNAGAGLTTNSTGIYLNALESNTAFAGNPTTAIAITGPGAYWGIRNDASHNFILGMYNAGVEAKAIQVAQAGGVTLGYALTYGGVTLSNSVTGTGSMVLSATPVISGIATFTGRTELTSPGGSQHFLIAPSSSGTGFIQLRATNTGGDLIWGVENSAGTGISTGAGAYAAVYGSAGANATALLTNDIARLTISSAGAIKFNTGYGAGTITSDASGNLTSVSDPAEKDFVAAFEPALAQILAIAQNDKYMGLHRWRKDNVSGQETEGVYASFFAHDDFPITDAVHKGANGINSFSDRPVVMALVNAVAELTTRLAALESK